MPPRRSYKKSTNGCKTCKRRRVKCDEIRPQCGQCNKHGVHCDYSSMDARCTSVDGQNKTTCLRSTPNSESTQYGPTVPPPLPPPSQTGRGTEMRLIHHCGIMTHKTTLAIQDTQLRQIWCDEVPYMTFQDSPCNPLQDLLLAISASHLFNLNPNEQELRLASLRYLDSGLRTFSGMLAKINDENAPVAFLSSVLIALQTLVSRLELNFERRYHTPIAWFWGLKGIRSIALAHRSSIKKSRIAPILFHHPLFGTRSVLSDNSPFKELLASLLDENADGASFTTYSNAVDYLSWVYAVYQGGEEKDATRRKILAFPTMVSPQYLSLLELCDSKTLVITAHFFALISFVDDIWWLQGVAEREIMGILNHVPSNMLWAMKWPLQQVRQCSLNTFDAPG